MDPFIGAAAIGAAGGIAEGLISGFGARRANRDNLAHSREQMAWQERLSSTAYQRSVMDMKSAGLNPLYWLKGGGASTPPGGLSRNESITEGIRGTTARALEARMGAAQIRNLDAQNAQIMSQTSFNLASAKEVQARTRAIQAGLPKKQFFEELWKIPGSVHIKPGPRDSLEEFKKKHPKGGHFGPIRWWKKGE